MMLLKFIYSQKTFNIFCRIRMNFLNHMEEWHVQASDRAESVVIAKVNHIYTMLYEPQKTFSKFKISWLFIAIKVLDSELLIEMPYLLTVRGVEQ